MVRTPTGGWIPVNPEPSPLGSIVLDQFDSCGPGEEGATPDYGCRFLRHLCSEWRVKRDKKDVKPWRQLGKGKKQPKSPQNAIKRPQTGDLFTGQE